MRLTWGVTLALAAACAKLERSSPATVDAAPTAAVPVDAPPAARLAVPDLGLATSMNVVYFAPRRARPVAAAIARCGRLTRLRQVSPADGERPRDAATWSVEELDEGGNFASENPRFWRGLDEATIARRPKPTRVLGVAFHGPSAERTTLARDAARVTACLAEAVDGLAADVVTRQLFSREAWKEARVDAWFGDVPDLYRQLVVHSYSTGELVRSVSLGMSKVGLPELVVNDHARQESEAIAMLLTFTGQTMLAPGAVGADGTIRVDLAAQPAPLAAEVLRFARAHGGTGAARLRLVEGKLEEGDNPTRLLEVAFASGEARSQALLELFGVEDNVIGAAADDAELRAASARARARLARLAPRFARRVPDMERLVVKAPFETSDGVEYMWVEVTRWRGDAITGLLMNQPRGRSARRVGSRVTVKVADVYDYLHEHDGVQDGNETSAILERR